MEISYNEFIYRYKVITGISPNECLQFYIIFSRFPTFNDLEVIKRLGFENAKDYMLKAHIKEISDANKK